jgi:prefoldin subunit 5
MDSMQSFQARLALLDSMLSKLKTSHARVKQLKRSVHVLRHLLKDQKSIQSPYGPETPIARFSLQ